MDSADIPSIFLWSDALRLSFTVPVDVLRQGVGDIARTFIDSPNDSNGSLRHVLPHIHNVRVPKRQALGDCLVHLFYNRFRIHRRRRRIQIANLYRSTGSSAFNHSNHDFTWSAQSVYCIIRDEI